MDAGGNKGQKKEENQIVIGDGKGHMRWRQLDVVENAEVWVAVVLSVEVELHALGSDVNHDGGGGGDDVVVLSVGIHASVFPEMDIYVQFSMSEATSRLCKPTNVY